MYLHPSAVTGVVDRLEVKGHVARSRDPEDRRVVKVRLTADGKELVKRAPDPVQGKMVYGLRSLKGQELHVLYRSVKKLEEISGAENVKAALFSKKVVSFSERMRAVSPSKTKGGMTMKLRQAGLFTLVIVLVAALSACAGSNKTTE